MFGVELESNVEMRELCILYSRVMVTIRTERDIANLRQSSLNGFMIEMCHTLPCLHSKRHASFQLCSSTCHCHMTGHMTTQYLFQGADSLCARGDNVATQTASYHSHHTLAGLQRGGREELAAAACLAAITCS